jgi:hypothetical protein
LSNGPANFGQAPNEPSATRSVMKGDGAANFVACRRRGFELAPLDFRNYSPYAGALSGWHARGCYSYCIQ